MMDLAYDTRLKCMIDKDGDLLLECRGTIVANNRYLVNL